MPAAGYAVADVLKICESAVTAISDLGPDDDLFRAGASSLTLLRIRARIQEHFGVIVPITVFFNNPTAASIAAGLVKANIRGGEQLDLQPTDPQLPGSKAPLSFKQSSTVRRLAQAGTLPQAALTSLTRMPAGTIDTTRLRDALTKLWISQPSLRILVRPDGSAVWSNHPEHDYAPLTVQKLASDDMAIAEAQRRAAAPFEWGRLLFAVDLLQTDDSDFLLLRIDHLIADRQGFQVFERSLADYYQRPGTVADDRHTATHLATLIHVIDRESQAMSDPEPTALIEAVRSVSLRPSLPRTVSTTSSEQEPLARQIHRTLSPHILHALRSKAQHEKASMFAAALLYVSEVVIPGESLSGVMTQVDNRLTSQDQRVIGWLSNRVVVPIQRGVESPVLAVQRSIAAALELGFLPYPDAVSRFDHLHPADFSRPAIVFQLLEEEDEDNLWMAGSSRIPIAASAAPSPDVHIELHVSSDKARLRVLWSSGIVDDDAISIIVERLCAETLWMAFHDG